MAVIECPHCGVENDDQALFCEACGKALPSRTSSVPRVVGSDGTARTGAGQNMQADMLRKQAGKASTMLFVVAVLQLAGVALLYVLLEGKVSADDLRTLVVANVVLAAIFGGLGVWARSSPLPAAIVGLVLYLTVHAFAAVADPTSIVQGIIVKIIIIAGLVKAIQAGSKYKELQQDIARRGG